jgi:hypothetical protein
MMAYGSVSRLVFVRGAWEWVWCSFYVAVIIGLLQLYQWARVATVAVAIVNIFLIGAPLVKDQRWAWAGLAPILPQLVFYAFILAYLLSPKTGRAFTVADAYRAHNPGESMNVGTRKFALQLGGSVPGRVAHRFIRWLSDLFNSSESR